MSTPRHFSKATLVLTSAMCFFIFGTLAEVISSYSGKYTADLEKKQTLLRSMKEDVYPTDAEPRNNIYEKKAIVKDHDRSALRVENIDLAQIVPPAERIKVAYVGMSGTLSPQGSKKDFLRAKSNPRQ